MERKKRPLIDSDSGFWMAVVEVLLLLVMMLKTVLRLPSPSTFPLLKEDRSLVSMLMMMLMLLLLMMVLMMMKRLEVGFLLVVV